MCVRACYFFFFILFFSLSMIMLGVSVGVGIENGMVGRLCLRYGVAPYICFRCLLVLFTNTGNDI